MKVTLGPCLQYVAASLVAVMYTCVGTQSGWVAPMAPRLLANETHITCSRDQVSWMVSSRAISKLAYIIIFYFVVNRLGRKVLLLVACVPSVVGWLIITFATSCEELIVARVFDGLTATLLYVVPSIYISEISRDEVRGFFLLLKDFMENLASLLITSIAPYVSYQVLALVPAIFPAVAFVTFLWMPETPYYHLLKNRRDLAEKSLRRLRGVEDVSTELHEMQNFVDQRAHDGNPKFSELMNTPQKRLSFAIGLVLLVSMMWSGTVVLGDYKTLVFRLSNVGNEAADTNATVLLAVQLLSSIVSMFCVDRLGRRPLLIFSCTISALSMAVGACSFHLDTIPQWLPITWTTVFIAASTCGIQNLPWAVCSEIFPADVKILSATCLSFCLGVSAALASKLTPVIIDAWGVSTVLWCSDVVLILTLVFVVFLVPETNSKPFSKIQEELEAITKGRSVCCHRNEDERDESSVGCAFCVSVTKLCLMNTVLTTC